MVDSHEQEIPRAAPQAVALAEKFLKKYGEVIDEEILFQERFGGQPEATPDGAMPLDLAPDGTAGKMKQFVAAMYNVVRYAEVDADALRSGMTLFSQEMLQSGKFSRHDRDLAERAEDIYRRKHEIPDYVELTPRQQARVDKFRAERLEFSREMDATADRLMEIQSDLIPLLRSLNIPIHSIARTQNRNNTPER